MRPGVWGLCIPGVRGLCIPLNWGPVYQGSRRQNLCTQCNKSFKAAPVFKTYNTKKHRPKNEHSSQSLVRTSRKGKGLDIDSR